MPTLGQLAIRTKVLKPEDSLGKAAEAVRCSTVGAAPVAEDGQLLGMVTAAGLAELLAEESPERARELTVAALALDEALALPAGLEPREALLFLRANEAEAAPVLSYSGELLGMVSVAELASAVCGRIRPPIIGGMATPFGVYLTGGGVRGGVGDLALMSTGIYMALLNIVALLLTQQVVGARVWALSVPHVGGWLAGFLNSSAGVGGVMWVLFAVLFRLSWITGFHAAEHQVVHTIEAGDDLRPEVVRRKPRVHPRCGTNLVVAVMLMSAFWEDGRGTALDGAQPVLAMVLTFLLWRRLGGLVQQYVTTRPASPRQIDSGIRAAEQLMEQYQRTPVGRTTAFRRIWNMGLLQVMAGFMLVLGGLWLLQYVIPLPEELRQML